MLYPVSIQELPHQPKGLIEIMEKELVRRRLLGDTLLSGGYRMTDKGLIPCTIYITKDTTIIK